MRRPGRPLVARAAVTTLAVAALGVLATGVVDPRGWSLTGAVVAQQPGSGAVDLGGRPSVLVCPPAPRLAAEVSDDDADEDFRAESPARTETVLRTTDGVADAAAVLGDEGRPASRLAVEASGDGSVVSADGLAPAVVQAAPGVTVGALAVAVADEGDLAGLAASSCTYPVESGWLVGGGVEAGRSGRVVLSNPGATTSTVDLVVLTPEGPVSPPAGQDVVVPGGASREVLLEGLLGPTPALAVGVTARGGAVAAHLVDGRLAGVRAQGVEQVPLTQAGTSLMVPGVLPGPATDAVLRLANPGTAPAAVGWQLLGPDGTQTQEGESVVTVPAGSVVEVPVEEVRRAAARVPVALALQVTSDQPVAAAVQTTVARDDGLADHAVAPTAALLDGTAVVPVAADDRVRSALALAASDGGGTVEVEVLDADGARVGEVQEVRIEPGRTAVVTVPADAAALRLQVRSGQVAATTVLWSQPGTRARVSFVAVAPVLVPPRAPDDVRVDRLSPDVLRAPAGSEP